MAAAAALALYALLVLCQIIRDGWIQKLFGLSMAVDIAILCPVLVIFLCGLENNKLAPWSPQRTGDVTSYATAPARASWIKLPLLYTS